MQPSLNKRSLGLLWIAAACLCLFSLYCGPGESGNGNGTTTTNLLLTTVTTIPPTTTSTNTTLTTQTTVYTGTTTVYTGTTTSTVPAFDCLVINEVNYDDSGADDETFIELYNCGSTTLNLSLYDIAYVNGFDGAFYDQGQLSGMLAPGGYYVITTSTDSASVTGFSDIVIGASIQNGAPDGVAIVPTGENNCTNALDIVSYEGNVPGCSQSDAGIDSGSTIGESLSRCPNGFDSNATSDFLVRSHSPGVANMCSAPTTMTTLPPSTLTSSTTIFTGTTTVFTGTTTTTVPSIVCLVINEVNYDDGGADDETFVELYNCGTSPLDLSSFDIAYMNGFDGSIYTQGQLSGMLAPGAYYVITTSVDSASVAAFSNIVVGTSIQNGAPDGIAIIPSGESNCANAVDIVSYEGNVAGCSDWDAGVDNSATDAESLSRCPNGIDTNDASADFTVAPHTPGMANNCTPMTSTSTLPVSTTSTLIITTQTTVTTVYTGTTTMLTSTTTSTNPGCTNENDHLLITEIGYDPVTGDGGANSSEFIEIYNPTCSPIALDDYYLTDDEDIYFNLPMTGSLVNSASDFTFRFPSGSVIPAKSIVVVTGDAAVFLADRGFANLAAFNSLPGSPQLFTQPGFTNGNGEMRNSGSTTVISLTNGGEPAILFYWDGSDDLIFDVDYVVWINASFIVAKDILAASGVDGPDGDLSPSFYATDLADGTPALDANQPDTIIRIDLLEGIEDWSGFGNGIVGDDETSEDWNNTFAVTASPSPGVL